MCYNRFKIIFSDDFFLMCYTDIFLVKKGLCVKLGFVCVTTIDPYIKFTPGVKDIQILATKGVTTPVGLNELYQFSHGLNIKALYI